MPFSPPTVFSGMARMAFIFSSFESWNIILQLFFSRHCQMTGIINAHSGWEGFESEDGCFKAVPT